MFNVRHYNISKYAAQISCLVMTRLSGGIGNDEANYHVSGVTQIEANIVLKMLNYGNYK